MSVSDRPDEERGHRRRNSYPAMRLNVAATAARGLEAPGEIYHDDGEQVLPQPGGSEDAWVTGWSSARSMESQGLANNSGVTRKNTSTPMIVGLAVGLR